MRAEDGARREARVCNGERAARRRAFSRDRTQAQGALGAGCPGKAICHCINLYWTGAREEYRARRKEAGGSAPQRPDPASITTSLALWGQPRNSIAFARDKNVSRKAQ